MIADRSYCVKAMLAGQHIALHVDAEAGQFLVEADGADAHQAR